VRLAIIVRADQTGLGYQTKSYYKHLKPHKTVVIDISNLNGNEQYYDWYKDAHIYKGIPNDEQCRQIINDTDVLLTAETPYNLNLFKIARENGVKTVCVENPEFFDGFKYPQLQLPDLIILPSVWKENEIRQFAEKRGTKVVQIHHPVDLNNFNYQTRKTHRFMHIAGTPAVLDRNGTWDFLQAKQDGIITTQNEQLAKHIKMRYSRSRIITGVNDNRLLYTYGDILVMPRKYGGNCLPLNEALATGMPVIMPDIEPNNNILPKEWLVRANKTGYIEPRGEVVDIYSIDIQQLKEKINWFETQDIQKLSEQAYEIAKTISWDTLKPKYFDVLEALL
jgi:glycosyltransferase involved in cell wall biosynthesis